MSHDFRVKCGKAPSAAAGIEASRRSGALLLSSLGGEAVVSCILRVRSLSITCLKFYQYAVIEMPGASSAERQIGVLLASL